MEHKFLVRTLESSLYLPFAIDRKIPTQSSGKFENHFLIMPVVSGSHSGDSTTIRAQLLLCKRTLKLAHHN